MGATKQNKIDSLASRKANATFRVPPWPSLSESFTTHGLKEGLRRWDARMVDWARTLERDVNEHIVKAPEVSSGDPG